VSVHQDEPACGEDVGDVRQTAEPVGDDGVVSDASDTSEPSDAVVGDAVGEVADEDAEPESTNDPEVSPGLVATGDILWDAEWALDGILATLDLEERLGVSIRSDLSIED